MRAFEIVSLPHQDAKESSSAPFPRLAVIAARSCREACQAFRRWHGYLATTTIWRARETSPEFAAA